MSSTVVPTRDCWGGGVKKSAAALQEFSRISGELRYHNCFRIQKSRNSFSMDCANFPIRLIVALLTFCSSEGRHSRDSLTEFTFDSNLKMSQSVLHSVLS